jgi:hypothetical protein
MLSGPEIEETQDHDVKNEYIYTYIHTEIKDNVIPNLTHLSLSAVPK